MTKYINGAEFRPASEVAREEQPLDIISHLQLRLANGEKLDSILRSYAWHLAKLVDETTEATETILNGAALPASEYQDGVLAGRRLVSDEIRRDGGR